ARARTDQAGCESSARCCATYSSQSPYPGDARSPAPPRMSGPRMAPPRIERAGVGRGFEEDRRMIQRSSHRPHLRTLAALVVVVVVASCSSGGAGASGASTGSKVLDRIKAAGPLRAGYAAAWPWLGQDPKTNEYFGPNDLIGKKMAEKLGVKLERVTQTFDQL